VVASLLRAAVVLFSSSGQITSNEFHELFVTDASSPFLHHLFDVIDVNRDQTLTFSEFLAVICTFCCYTELQMVKCQCAADDTTSDNSGAAEGLDGMGRWEGWRGYRSV